MVRSATSWYMGHMKDQVEVVLLTDDVENKSLAISQGIKAFNGLSFFYSLTLVIIKIDECSEGVCEQDRWRVSSNGCFVFKRRKNGFKFILIYK